MCSGELLMITLVCSAVRGVRLSTSRNNAVNFIYQKAKSCDLNLWP